MEQKYDIFLSWGDDEQKIGEELVCEFDRFLTDEVFGRSLRIFNSTKIMRGAWDTKVNKALDDSKFGIFLFTEYALSSTWVQHEYDLLLANTKREFADHDNLLCLKFPDNLPINHKIYRQEQIKTFDKEVLKDYCRYICEYYNFRGIDLDSIFDGLAWVYFKENVTDIITDIEGYKRRRNAQMIDSADLLFVSWTNRDGLGKELGEAFSNFFDYFDLGIEVVYSDRDLGSDWYHVLNENLQRAKFGVFCITPKAVNSSWINYELGAILNNNVSTKCIDIKDNRVYPIQLTNIDRVNRPKMPLSYNNVKMFCEDELKKIIDSLLKEYISKNKIEAVIALDKYTHVNQIFKLAYKKLQKQVEAILAKERPEKIKSDGSAEDKKIIEQLKVDLIERQSEVDQLKTENDGLKSEIIELKNQIKVIQTPIQTPPSVTETAPRELIDLGFSVLWADRNIGANSPADFGEYFAWGETIPKVTYSWDNYKYCQDGDYNMLTKYCTDKDYGKVDNKRILDPEDDAATYNWDNGWRMPTVEEYKELFANCNLKWTKRNGVNGCEFTSKKNGNKIFFPAAGAMWPVLSYAGSNGFYWSSSLSVVNPYRAQFIYFNSDHIHTDNGNYRYGGFPVRAVLRMN